MDWHEVIYQELSQLEPAKVGAMLRQLLPPARLAMLMDGTLFRFSEHGASLFRISAVLAEAGIPPDDPRTRMFSRLFGSLINPAIPLALHAIASKQDSILAQLGAVKSFDEHGRKAWWVPLGQSSVLEQRCRDWFAEFELKRQELLLDPHREVYVQSRERVLRSAGASWEDLDRAGKTAMGRDAYLQEAERIFTARFPTAAQIAARVRLAMTPCQGLLPEDLERIYRKLQNKAREKEAAEIKAIHARTRKEAVQLELLALERDRKQAELDQMKAESEVRERLIREAVQGEVAQARTIVLQVQSRIIRLSQEILMKAQQGTPVSASTRRSWNKTFQELSALTPDHPHLAEALQSIRAVSVDPKEADPVDISAASREIGEALAQLERKAAVSLHADALWQLLSAGKAEEALRKLQQIRGELTGKLDEVESLYELMTSLGAHAPEATDEDADELEAEEAPLEAHAPERLTE